METLNEQGNPNGMDGTGKITSLSDLKKMLDHGAQTSLGTVLTPILFRDLPNGAHYDYVCRVSAELAQAGDLFKNVIGSARIGNYNASVAIEDNLIRWAKKSVLTEQIAEADHRLDRSVSAINAQVENARYSDDPDTVASAERLRVILRQYGDVGRKPYNVEEGLVKAMLGNMHGPYAADVTKLALGPRVAILQDAYNEFEALLKQRDDIQLQKPAETFKEVRQTVEAYYHEISDLANSGARLQLSQDFRAFINKLNPEIERLNRLYHHAKTDIKGAQPANIGPQPFTGLAVTPLPEVLFIKQDGSMERLVFGVDYSLTYRNNVNVGKAECIIHGKGKYRGTNTVSFVIVHV